MEPKKSTPQTEIQLYRDIETVPPPKAKTAVARERPANITAAKKRAIREVLLTVTSCIDEAFNDIDDDHQARFDLSASQINSDLALAAFYEAVKDVNMDSGSDGFYELLRSPEFRRLRDHFIEESVEMGDRGYAFMAAVWRGYIAGRVCPERFVPRTQKERDENNRQQREAFAEIKLRAALTHAA